MATQNIHDSIASLAMDISLLLPLDKNPRIGNVDAIVSSYLEFGQMKPIVVRPDGKGKYTVIAGNHQLQAAKKLGWEKIAAVVYDVDEKRANAFALADNRTTELGNTDQAIVLELMSEISTDYQDLLLGLGWDDFEVAAISSNLMVNDTVDNRGGYVAPVITNPFEPREEETGDDLITTMEDENEEEVFVATDKVDHSDAATRGSVAVGVKGGERAVVQYTLVFDDADQQKRWYDFIRYLRNDPAYVGDTTASKLIDFIDSNAEF